MTINATRLGSLIIIFGSICALIDLKSYPFDAALFPKMLLFLMMIFCALLFCRSYKVDAYKAKVVVQRKNQVIICTAIITSYAIITPFIGYYAASALFLLAMAYYLRFQSKIVALAVAVGYPILIYVVFEVLLHIPVPEIGF
ncbi:hypothetical protein FACS1894168_3690 [Deltaproteobacteria bacterium]|nr:hypothetical protein FACS1894168_3690 [Deltaproteobacteria bacterium]